MFYFIKSVDHFVSSYKRMLIVSQVASFQMTHRVCTVFVLLNGIVTPSMVTCYNFSYNTEELHDIHKNVFNKLD